MTFSPAPTNILLEVLARVDLGIVGIETVQNFGGSMYTFGRFAEWGRDRAGRNAVGRFVCMIVWLEWNNEDPH